MVLLCAILENQGIVYPVLATVYWGKDGTPGDFSLFNCGQKYPSVSVRSVDSRLRAQEALGLRKVLLVYWWVATKPWEMPAAVLPQKPTRVPLSLMPLTMVVPMPLGSSTDWNLPRVQTKPWVLAFASV